jgi:hypothetical protein
MFFEIVARKFMPRFEGEGGKDKSPIIQESNASTKNKCDCLGEYDIHNNDTPKEKK